MATERRSFAVGGIVHAPTVIERARSIPAELRDWTPKSKLGLTVLRALPYLPRDLALELKERICAAAIIETELRLKVIRGLGLARAGLIPWAETVVEDYGVVSVRVVTTVGAGFIVDAFENLVEPEGMKYHAIGTGSTAEAAGDTALVTELTSEYNPDSTRATGSLAEASAQVFQTVGTNTLDSGSPALREHGILNQAATGGGVLLDRSVFAAINLTGANGDGLQSDYRLTINSGG